MVYRHAITLSVPIMPFLYLHSWNGSTIILLIFYFHYYNNVHLTYLLIIRWFVKTSSLSSELIEIIGLASTKCFDVYLVFRKLWMSFNETIAHECMTSAVIRLYIFTSNFNVFVKNNSNATINVSILHFLLPSPNSWSLDVCPSAEKGAILYPWSRSCLESLSSQGYLYFYGTMAKIFLIF